MKEMKLKSILLEGVEYIPNDRYHYQSACLSCDLYDYCHPKNNHMARGHKLLVICGGFGPCIYFKKAKNEK